MHACEHVHEAHAVLMALVYEVADQGKGTESVQRERVTAEQDDDVCINCKVAAVTNLD